MSLSSKSATRTAIAVRDREIRSDAIAEIRDYFVGLEALPTILTEEEIIRRDLCRCRRDLCRWMMNRLDAIHKVGLSCGVPFPDETTEFSDRVSFNIASWQYEGSEWRSDARAPMKARLFPHSLLNIGVDTPSKGNKFLEFYLQVYDPKKSWVSGHQVNQTRAAEIALTPNYNRLPAWVRQGLMNAPESAKIGGDRVGNIWRLPACVKAWKWCPDLPKKLAEKVGKLSPKMRMLAAWAWANTRAGKYDFSSGSYYTFSRTERERVFWELLSDMQHCRLADLLDWMWSTTKEYSPQWGRYRWAAFLNQYLSLPWGLIELPNKITKASINDAIVQYGTPEQACRALFGVAGKETVRLFKISDRNHWDWAKAIAFGNADAIQKVLAMPVQIGFQPEAVEFLNSLPMRSRIRLLGATTFKYRGEEHPVTDDHVRDTGYLWEKIQEKPDLGRVRCWFSTHEVLSAAFVEALSDQPLPIHQGWVRVDGLSEIKGRWELEFPRSVANLKYYGTTLRNCVGGYGPAIKSGRSVIFVVKESGLPTHCVEVTGGSIRQFYRAGNSSADWQIKDSVIAALEQANLL